VTDDRRDFLTRNGFPVTRRADGSFDVKGIGEGMTSDAVWNAFFRLYFWPDPWPAKREGPPVPQRLCGG
jgi:hypothetical protein